MLATRIIVQHLRRLHLLCIHLDWNVGKLRDSLQKLPKELKRPQIQNAISGKWNGKAWPNFDKNSLGPCFWEGIRPYEKILRKGLWNLTHNIKQHGFKSTCQTCLKYVNSYNSMDFKVHLLEQGRVKFAQILSGN